MKGIISFDGLNRAGKNTQISLLNNYLCDNGYRVAVMRGDGSRKGNGSSDDPVSTWWQDLQKRLYLKDEQGNYDQIVWREAAKRLNEEILDELDAGNSDYILLDRSLISRVFVEQSHDTTKCLQDIIRSISTNEGRVVVPDIGFILHVPQTVLLKRNLTSYDCPEKRDFRKDIILGYYDAFENITKQFALSGLRVIHIDGNSPTLQIFEKVLEYCREQTLIK